jgi:nucleoside 2-deoxyribosyltransferase
MKVYFACSITGGRQDEAIYQEIVDAMLVDGHEVPTAILASPKVMALEANHKAEDVFARDIAWIEESNSLVAEVTTPSHGVGYEISYALSIGKPVLCLFQSGKTISKMLLGNNSPLIQVNGYGNSDEAIKLVRGFLNKA